MIGWFYDVTGLHILLLRNEQWKVNTVMYTDLIIIWHSVISKGLLFKKRFLIPLIYILTKILSEKLCSSIITIMLSWSFWSTQLYLYQNSFLYPFSISNSFRKMGIKIIHNFSFTLIRFKGPNCSRLELARLWHSQLGTYPTHMRLMVSRMLKPFQGTIY